MWKYGVLRRAIGREFPDYTVVVCDFIIGVPLIHIMSPYSHPYIHENVNM